LPTPSKLVNDFNREKYMSNPTPPEPTMTDQQKNGEEILREMQARNGGELVRGEDGRLRLVHQPPAPSR
jgi:hypothetical protein